jgi:hypothetical protein
MMVYPVPKTSSVPPSIQRWGGSTTATPESTAFSGGRQYNCHLGNYPMLHVEKLIGH